MRYTANTAVLPPSHVFLNKGEGARNQEASCPLPLLQQALVAGHPGYRTRYSLPGNNDLLFGSSGMFGH